MKPTKKLEAEVKQAYHTFWKSLLNVDLKTFNALLDDDFRQIGTTEAEAFFNKKAVAKFLKVTEEQIVGNIELRNQKLRIESLDKYVLITDLFDCYVKIDNEWTFYERGRSTFLLHKTRDGWKFILQHTSFPDNRTEYGETIGLQKVAKENLELRDAIKRRTIELENKNRELEIETALENVRAVAMAMHRPDDLSVIGKTIFTELQSLGFENIRNTEMVINHDEKKSVTSYHYSDYGKDEVLEINYTENPIVKKWANDLKKADDAFVPVTVPAAKLKEWNAYRKQLGYKTDPGMRKAKAVHYYSYSIGLGALSVSNWQKLSEEKIKILERFRNVFQLSYKRYKDIEQAEAQTREAQIQLALERVRARTMAMHDSDELTAVVKLLYQEFDKLKISNETTDIEIGLIDEETGIATIWAHIYLSDGTITTFNFPIDKFIGTVEEYKRWKITPVEKRNELFFTSDFSGKQWDKIINWVNKSPELKEVFQPLMDAKITRWVTHNAYFSHGMLTLQGMSPYSTETQEIQKRFTKVFEQTYTRFRDLQKAEAQAREAQIEASLERVRSRAMAIRKSDELSEVIQIIFLELNKLGIDLMECSIATYHDKNPKDLIYWSAGPFGSAQSSSTKLQYIDHPLLIELLNDFESGTQYRSGEYSGELLKTWWDRIFVETDFRYAPKDFIKSWKKIKKVFYSQAAMNHGFLEFLGKVPLPEDKVQILKRFTNVIDLTYTRYDDVVKAEAQAREAQIELALERVRARTMGMQRSDELPQAATLLFQQIQTLGMPAFAAGYCIWDDDKQAITLWMSSEGVLQPPFKAPTTEDELFIEMRKGYEQGKSLHVVEMGGEDLVAHYKYMRTLPVVGQIFDSIGESGHSLPVFQVMHQAYFSKGFLLFITYEPVTASHDIFLRFANVFDQTYTRFLDLQKAEAQAREAQIEAALERVRARAMAMYTSEELKDVAMELRHQMGLLGQKDLEVCAIHLYEEDKDYFESWGAMRPPGFEDKIFQGTAKFPKSGVRIIDEMMQLYKSGQKDYVIVNEKEGAVEWFDVIKKNAPEAHAALAMATKDIPVEKLIAYWSLSDFSGGSLLLVTHTFPDEKSRNLLRRSANVFDLAYRRFKDLKKAEAQALKAEQDLIEIKAARKKAEEALTELQTTQKQLIQSEKMASLGELTAGIAHEIQNPLNFVNNFSEVNKELVDELQQELRAGKIDVAMEISNDIKANEEKINHHGKRADAIVKGMLQHSRSSSGQKESTDINALADEYLRLAYHGLRAKDKSFNVSMKTEFDETIGNINIIPQDIGRVILNLINNAFYVVNEKSKQNIIGYEPTVEVSTKKEGNKVLVNVKDNGNGIPQKILDKIFQPFFTTKPTGQGTGLGLSLSYDIVKAHGGEIRAETLPAGEAGKEGNGTEFIIQLPI